MNTSIATIKGWEVARREKLNERITAIFRKYGFTMDDSNGALRRNISKSYMLNLHGVYSNKNGRKYYIFSDPICVLNYPSNVIRLLSVIKKAINNYDPEKTNRRIYWVVLSNTIPDMYKNMIQDCEVHNLDTLDMELYRDYLNKI